MKIGEAIEKLDRMQQNTEDADTKLEWLRQLDMEIWREVILKHEGWEDVQKPDYEDITDDRELLVPEPYDSIYLHYMQSRIDYENKEYQQYNNSNAQFEADRMAYRCWYNRTHMPIQPKRRLVL